MAPFQLPLSSNQAAPEPLMLKAVGCHRLPSTQVNPMASSLPGLEPFPCLQHHVPPLLGPLDQHLSLFQPVMSRLMV